MGLTTAFQLLSLVASSFGVAAFVLFILGWMDRKSHVAKNGSLAFVDDEIAFLFDDETLVSATPIAQSLIAESCNADTDWTRLQQILAGDFPDLRQEIAELAEKGTLYIDATSGGARLKGKWLNGLAQISLFNYGVSEQKVSLDKSSFQAMQLELETLSSSADTAPFLVWRQQPDGTICWANKSYVELARDPESHGGIDTWPPRRLFAISNTTPVPPKTMSQRISTKLKGEAEPRWYECFETPLGEDSLFTAVSADKVVRAETALKGFVQTLTKTFAHLKIGLAIFDKQRRLALFNPALADLTSLSPEFLASRPILPTVLDQLREKQVLPEPKDYKSWRQQLFELEAAAVDGTFEETWSLPNGRTYRVTGQPHPEGALAFLIEDISAEISLTRRFRAELDVSQAILDSFSEAIVVFSSTGAMSSSNAAYDRLWRHETDTMLGSLDIIGATKLWAGQCSPSPVWGDAREFVGTLADRAEWTATVGFLDGRQVECRFKPISGGATLIGFMPPSAATENEQGSQPGKESSDIDNDASLSA